MNSRNQFLSNFDWTDSTLEPGAKQAVETLVDIGNNIEFKIELTPVENRPTHSQSFSAPKNRKDDSFVELALLHKYGIIITLTFGIYASPVFVQKKPTGKPRQLVDLNKINTLSKLLHRQKTSS